jgi:16S rRNA G966 N2-methylase RsmD
MTFYSEIIPFEFPIRADRQGAKRHYGVHPYFTRRPFNVVREYILKFSQERDRVLDPFGGSGVTAIEAFLENRVGLHNDINPLANFIANGVVDLSNGYLRTYEEALLQLEETCKPRLFRLQQLDNEKLEDLKQEIDLPDNVNLPKTSDVKTYYELFSLKQLICLAILKKAVDSIKDLNARKAMVLAWSATLTKINKTFLSAEGRAESRGGSSIFSIYRYKVAKNPIELPVWATFHERAVNVLRAKAEIDQAIQLKRQTGGWFGEFKSYDQDIEDLSRELKNSVDYIFTDPPYGGHISYLDLSTLWNSWLDMLPIPSQREKELIVGGDLKFTEDHYVEKLAKSVKSCLRMLRKDRWLSIVFQHWNPSYFECILSSATESGAELRAAVPQVGDPIWSMHKKKNQSVLAGEMILTFQKTGKTERLKANGNFDIASSLKRILNNLKTDHVFGEYVFNKMIIEAWKNCAIHSLSTSRVDLPELLISFGWHYQKEDHSWVKEKPKNSFLYSASS